MLADEPVQRGAQVRNERARLASERETDDAGNASVRGVTSAAEGEIPHGLQISRSTYARQAKPFIENDLPRPSIPAFRHALVRPLHLERTPTDDVHPPHTRAEI